MYLSLEFFPTINKIIKKINLKVSDNDLGYRGV
jgi:hypothetical protein